MPRTPAQDALTDYDESETYDELMNRLDVATQHYSDNYRKRYVAMMDSLLNGPYNKFEKRA